jgi:hypothetical protein
MTRRVLVITGLAAAVACHHAPPAAPPPQTAAAPPGPAVWQDTTAKWAGVHPRTDTTTSTGAVAPKDTASAASGAEQKASGAEEAWAAANLAIGDGVFIVRAHYGGRVYVGAGDATQTMTLQVDADAVDDFVRETRAFLPPKKPGRDTPPPVLEEPRSGRTMSFGRHISAGQARYRFFFSDDRLGGFSLPATLTETRAILAGLTRGAAMARDAQSHSQANHP